MKRWIIRSFFIVLLLVSVGVWVWSVDCCQIVKYCGPNNIWGIECCWGEIHIGWEKNCWDLRGWEICTETAQDDSYPAFEEFGQICIPFWFPIPCAALLWLVWRMTRPKAERRGFPVVLKN